MKDIKEQIKNSKIVIKPIDSLIPYAKNSRKHSEEQIEKVANSIREFGFSNPILIDKKDGIIAGHCRAESAKRLGLNEVPCIVLDVTEKQKRALVIADNQLALISEWDMGVLKEEYDYLEQSDFDVRLLGFDDGFFDSDFEYDPPNEGEKDPVKDLTLRVMFENEDEQQALFCELRDRGFKVKT